MADWCVCDWTRIDAPEDGAICPRCGGRFRSGGAYSTPARTPDEAERRWTEEFLGNSRNPASKRRGEAARERRDRRRSPCYYTTACAGFIILASAELMLAYFVVGSAIPHSETPLLGRLVLIAFALVEIVGQIAFAVRFVLRESIRGDGNALGLPSLDPRATWLVGVQALGLALLGPAWGYLLVGWLWFHSADLNLFDGAIGLLTGTIATSWWLLGGMSVAITGRVADFAPSAIWANGQTMRPRVWATLAGACAGVGLTTTLFLQVFYDKVCVIVGAFPVIWIAPALTIYAARIFGMAQARRTRFGTQNLPHPLDDDAT